MNLKQTIKLAAKSIAARKGRTFLTMLGVIIGLAAVITMVTYALTYAVQVGLYLVSIPWLADMGLDEFWVRLFSFVIAQGTATVLNFLIQKFLIFRT